MNNIKKTLNNLWCGLAELSILSLTTCKKDVAKSTDIKIKNMTLTINNVDSTYSSVGDVEGNSAYHTCGRIAGYNNKTLTNNKANQAMTVLGITHISSDASSLDGEDLDMSSLNQAIFENLGWDLSTVWVWDATAKLPKLRR